MIDWFSSALLLKLSVWFLLGALLCLGYPMLRGLWQRLPAAQASLLLLILTALPLVGSLWLGFSLYWPDMARWLVVDHCHSGLCQPHGPVSQMAVWPAGVLLLWVLLRLFTIWKSIWAPARRLSRELNFAAEAQAGYMLLPDKAIAAFTLGFWKPQVFLTQGLLNRCKPQQREIILAHESAHWLRGDNLRQLLLALFLAPLPQRWCATIKADHQLFCEQACDDMAATQSSRELVAETLIKLMRLQQQAPQGACAFAGSHTELRIRALLTEHRNPISIPALIGLITVLLGSCLLLVDPLHRVIESI